MTTSTGFFDSYNSNGNTGRGWFQSTDGGGTWTFAGNPDSWAPELSLANGDQVQFAVSPSSTPASPISTVALTVIFANDRVAANNPARIASPFALQGGNPRCILADASRTWSNRYLIGPYVPSVNTSNSGRGNLRFEFSIAAARHVPGRHRQGLWV